MNSPDDPSPNVDLCRLGTGHGPIALVCLPYAGGGTSIYRSWPKALPGVAVYALGLPGREGRLAEEPFAEIGALVAATAAAILTVGPEPYALFGHSMGALVAFETARRLRHQDAVAPAHLFVSGFRAPHLPDPKPPLHDLPHARFIDELRRINGDAFDPDGHSELLELMLPTLRADFRLVQTYAYRAEPPLVSPITAFGGLGDTDVDEQQLLGWRRHTSASFALKLFPGGHFFLQTAADNLLKEIGLRLNPQPTNPSWRSRET
ncbi:MAG: alpha/beta fold hydrolase [Rhizomicrobium sp.]